MATTTEQQALTGIRANLASKFGALSNPRYRRYWLGSLASVGAIQIAWMAQGWLIVDKLGGTALSLGFLGAATAIPTILVNVFGGVLADRVDRRKLIIVVSLASSLLLLLLAVLDSTNVIRIWHVVVIASVQGLVMGFDGPVRSSFFPLLIERKEMMSAVALGSVMWQFSRLVTPIAGGLLIAYGGTASVFYVGVVGWISMLLVMISLRVSSPPPDKSRDVVSDMVEGIRFIFGRRDFVLLIGLTYVSHFFGMQYLQLMPLFAQRFGREADGFGILLSALGLGALTGTIIVSRIRTHPRIGYIMLGGSLVFTAAVAGFAFTPWFYLALVVLYIGGLANTIYFVVAMTVLQLRVPEKMRGRVMGIYTITFSLIPLGGLMGGAIASIYDERVAVVIGAAILAAIFVVVGVTQPVIRRLDGTRLDEV
ncbi:MAG: MFS transporter [Gammaproteobacteria bacterium]|nr:MFS transporter [Gammaproteobacteria bacterium]